MNLNRIGSVFLFASLVMSMATGCANLNFFAKKEQKPAVVREEKPPVVEPPARIVPTGNVVNTIAAIVNEELITLAEVNREALPLIREAEKKSFLDDAARSQIKRMVVEQLIEKKLVNQKIQELKIKVGEDEIRQAIDDVRKQNNLSSQEALASAIASQGMSFDQYKIQMKDQLEKLKLVSMEVRSKIQVGETEMQEYYEANRSKYSEEETFRARHIFIRTNEKAAPEDIKRSMTTALMVLAEAKSGKDFAELAKSYSEDPAARKDGGNLGVFKKGDMMPELEASILSMKPGEVSELVYTPAGFHIVKLEERIVGRMKPFEKVKVEIEDTIYRKKSEERFSQWAKELRSKSSIEIKDLSGIM
jgi:peptidyl-prolyl cis-trans isomerase SurA